MRGTAQCDDTSRHVQIKGFVLGLETGVALVVPRLCLSVRYRFVAMAADSTGTGDVPEKKKAHAGIPEAVFVDDVDAFMKLAENNENADVVLQRLDEQHTKYKFMEHNLLQKRRRLKSQIPDIRSSLDIVSYMKAKLESPNPLETQFLLSDQVYVKAKIPPTDKVCLWLGANVMLEYSLDDAEALLSKNLETATKNLVQLDDDLDFLRDQFTTAEVIEIDKIKLDIHWNYFFKLMTAETDN
uniref:Prefoldin subunit 3 n=1 Tax=Strigamia maritima TaxID=126957 RepID=T1IY44_STRMM